MSEELVDQRRKKAQILRFLVGASDQDDRLDRYIARQSVDHRPTNGSCPALSRAQASRLCGAGRVLVEGRPQAKSFQVQQGQAVEVHLESPAAAQPAPEMALHLILETKQLVVVDKPAGIPCGAVRGSEQGTLAGALLSRFPEMAEVGYGPLEPGLVHRIDNFTSGLVLAARSTESFEALRKALSEGKLEKRYLALVAPGILPPRGEIDAPLCPDPRSKKRVRIDERGIAALSSFEVVARGSQSDLVVVAAHRAYRHQIRCHLASWGAPLLGDLLYGSADSRLSPRHALHAYYIKSAAEEVAPFEAKSPLPEDLRSFLPKDSGALDKLMSKPRSIAKS